MTSFLRLGFRRRNRCWLLVTLMIFGIFFGPKLAGISEHRHYYEEDVMDSRLARFSKYQMSESHRIGPGEQGKGHYLKGADETVVKKRQEEEGMNIMASDEIALDRAIKDVRDSRCRAVSYPQDLPTVSVIIIYFNEAWSPILRTVHSVVNRTPPKYLHEVILLDDSSTRPELLEPLQTYVDTTWPDGIVRVLRTPTRLGLVGARQFGAEAVTGDVIFFLDAHCEAGRGWAEPILSRIKEKRTAVLCPTIDSIDGKSLAYTSMGSGAVGGFSWGMHFTWWFRHRGKSNTKDATEPYSSPTMAGGLVAIDRKYFFELGGYDTKMEIWGGENLEMSFRVWMCGGSLEFVPCSHVGHIFRATHPYGFPSKTRDYHGLNSKRLAEVWLDGYKRIFYLFRPDIVRQDAGNVSDRIALRERLHCHDFRWYLNNVYPEKFVFDENVTAYGQIRNPASNWCFDTLNQEERHSFDIGLYHCHPKVVANQLFTMTYKREIRRELTCLDAYKSNTDPEAKIKFSSCHSQGGAQDWHYSLKTQQISYHDTGKCITVPDLQPQGQRVLPKLLPCLNNDLRQKWEFSNYLESHA